MRYSASCFMFLRAVGTVLALGEHQQTYFSKHNELIPDAEDT